VLDPSTDLRTFVFLHFANRVDRRRYGHIAECHPLLARLVWEPELGPKPLGGIYRRRCHRWLCLFRRTDALLRSALTISLDFGAMAGPHASVSAHRSETGSWAG
jgi:hypothetical protein